jgi:hypothetical protein
VISVEATVAGAPQVGGRDGELERRAALCRMPLREAADAVWEILRSARSDMRVPARVFADRSQR